MTGESLLARARQIHRVFLESGSLSDSFNQEALMLSDVLKTGIVIVDEFGLVLGACFAHVEWEETSLVTEKQGSRYILSRLDLLNLPEPSYNLKRTGGAENEGIFAAIPIVSGGDRLGTLVLARSQREFDVDDVILSEIGAAMTGLSILRNLLEKEQERIRIQAVVEVAFESLSYSEIEAVEEIVSYLDGLEGIIVASKIADEIGITRSVIVNSLRKFESAGILKSRSLGMKGTFVQFTSPQILREISALSPKLKRVVENARPLF